MKQNEKVKKKLMECPECLGLGVEYQPEIDQDETCKLCKGSGKVEETLAKDFNPLSFINKTEQIDEIEEDEEFDY